MPPFVYLLHGSNPVSRGLGLKFFTVPCGLFVFALCAVLPAFSQQTTPVVPALSVENRPFTPALQVGDSLYLSGHLGLDRKTSKPPTDASEEAKQVMDSVRSSLEQAGMTMNDLVYVEVYCTDLSLYNVFNKEYVSYFHKPYPARDFIGAKDLLFGAHFEVMGIAVRHAAENKKQPATAP
jgi:2-iminobutanoate/2-iminopropanoate deaminase